MEEEGSGSGDQSYFPDAAPSESEPSFQPDAQAAFVPLEITDLSVANGKSYPLILEGAENGQKRYIDRDYKFKNLPPLLAGVPFIKTANDDADSKGAAFITFSVNKPVTVYVAHDDRKGTKPAWLTLFTDTGLELRDTDDKSEGFSIYAAEFAAGTVPLGGNIEGGDDKSMYSAFVADSELP